MAVDPEWDWSTSKVNARKITLNPAFSGKPVNLYLKKTRKDPSK